MYVDKKARNILIDTKLHVRIQLKVHNTKKFAFSQDIAVKKDSFSASQQKSSISQVVLRIQFSDTIYARKIRLDTALGFHRGQIYT
jgi:hypothetical protein